MKLKQVIQLPDAGITCRVVKIFWNAETEEFVCQLFISGGHYEPADYFTNDKDDAIDTAKLMCVAPKTDAQKIFEKYPEKGYCFAASVVFDSVSQGQNGAIKHWIFADGSMIYFNTENKGWTV